MIRPMAEASVAGLQLVDPPPLATGRSQPGDRRIHRLANRQFAANLASVLGAVLCVGAGIALAADLSLMAVASLFTLGVACDAVDGTIARSAGRSRAPEKGAFTDSFCDKAGEGGMFLGLVVYFQNDPLILVLASFGFVFGWLGSSVKALAEFSRLGVDWSDARVFGRAIRVALLSSTLALGAALGGQRHSVWVIGFSVLVTFNLTILTRRLLRTMACKDVYPVSH